MAETLISQLTTFIKYFHEIGILSGMTILAPYQIDIVKGCGFWNAKKNINWIFIFILPTNHDFRIWKQHLFGIFSFLQILKQIISKKLVELQFNSISSINFHAQLVINVILYIIKIVIIAY